MVKNFKILETNFYVLTISTGNFTCFHNENLKTGVSRGRGWGREGFDRIAWKEKREG